MRIWTPPTPAQLSRAGALRVAQISGKYYTSPFAVLGANTANNEVLKAMPLIIGTKGTIDRLGCNVSIVGQNGCTVRLGLYADTGSFKPGALLVDAGTVAADAGAGTGNKEITVSVPVDPGIYWMAAVSQGGSITAPTLLGYTPQVPWVANDSLGFISSNCGSWGVSAVSGGLPDPFTTSMGTQGTAYKLVARFS